MDMDLNFIEAVAKRAKLVQAERPNWDAAITAAILSAKAFTEKAANNEPPEKGINVLVNCFYFGYAAALVGVEAAEKEKDAVMEKMSNKDG